MHKSSLQATLDFFAPSKAGAVFYSGFSVLFIAYARLSNLLENTAGIVEIREGFRSVGEFVAEKAGQYSAIPNLVVWFSAGAIAYLLIWAAVVVFIDGYNNVVTSVSFVHPKSFHLSEYWVAILGRLFVRLASGILLISVLASLFGAMIPAAFREISGKWAEDGVVVELGRYVAIVALGMLLQHVVIVLLRLVLLKRRLY